MTEMEEVKFVEFADLADSLTTPLPTRPEMVETVRELVSVAEAYGVVVSQYVRVLSQKCDEETDQVLQDLRQGAVIDEDGTLTYSKEEAERYKKLNADEKKAAVAGRMAELNAKLEFVKNLDALIKRRVSVGQSFIKSFTENKA